MVGRMRAEQSPDDPEEHKSRSCLPFRLPPRHPPSNKKKENPLLEKPAYQPYNSASKTKKRPSRIPSTSNQRSPVSLTPSRNSSIRSSDTTPRHSRNSSSSSNPLESLLVPPTPIDRSPQTLHRLSSSGKKQQRRGLYDGEIEPEGVRGQEAVVVSPDQEPSIPIPVRNFRAASPSLPAVQERAPLQFSPETGKAVRFQPEGVASDPSRLMPRFTRNHSDAESTNSDDDIEYMMADFLPSDTSGGISPQPSQQQRSTSVLERGSPLQIVAAVPSSSNSSASSGNHTHQQNTSLEQLNAAALEHVHRAEYDSALQIFTRVLQIYKTQNHPKSLQASAYHNLGTVHAKRAAMLPEDSPAQRHCRATALEHFQAAARHARDSLGANHPNVAVSLVRIGFLLLQSRQYPHAVVTFQEALRIRLAAFGREHGLVANLYNNLGVCHMHLQEFAQGRDQLELALQIQRDLVENEDGHQKNMSTSTDPWVHQLELADTLFNLGGLHLEWIRKQGPDVRRRKDAIAAFTETWQIRQQVLGPNDPSVVQVKSLLEMARAIPAPHPLNGEQSQIPQRRSPRVSPVGQARSPQEIISQLPQRRSPRVSPVSQPSRLSQQSSQSTSPASQPSRIPQRSSPRELDLPQMSSPRESPRDPPGVGASRIVPPSRRKAAEGGGEVFRSYENKTHNSRKAAPILEVSISREDDEVEPSSKRRVIVEPHLVPETSPSRAANNYSNEAIGGQSHELSLDTSSVALETSKSYDAEESCMLKDTGVDSEHGRVHYPLTWQKMEKEGAGIVVAQPYRSPSGNTSTGNKDRDDVLDRARAILSAHATSEDTPPRGSRTSNSVPRSDVLEDGIAPLGGDWSSKKMPDTTVRDMLHDPMNYLPDIHEAASKLLKNNNAMDAFNMFDIILQCQRRRHGPLHPDVASALHNVGIALLRAQNHSEALKAFEEAARVRKGSLGRDHPHVAISLVKVGITLLLLHRFDDALWSFREALAVRKHALGPLHPSTARIYNNIACVHVEFNEFKEARRAFEAALDVQRNALCHDPHNGPLMFGTATTLCNLGYLYRYRDMHTKAAVVLKEAVDLQENVLGRSHATVLSTLDNLADSYANSGHAVEALRTYNMILERFRVGDRPDNLKMSRAEAVLLYKISRVHRQQNDRQAQLDNLKLALRALRAYPDSGSDSLERRIQYDIRACREQLEKGELKWL